MTEIQINISLAAWKELWYGKCLMRGYISLANFADLHHIYTGFSLYGTEVATCILFVKKKLKAAGKPLNFQNTLELFNSTCFEADLCLGLCIWFDEVI